MVNSFMLMFTRSIVMFFMFLHVTDIIEITGCAAATGHDEGIMTFRDDAGHWTQIGRSSPLGGGH